jgi:preprotein translocase subunit SecA
MTRRKTVSRNRLGRFIDRLRGRPVEYNLKYYEKVLESIDARADELDLKAASDDELQRISADLKTKARSKTALDDLLVDAYALVREAAARTLGMRHFDVQMLAGIALQRGHLIEMQTGEGKTLVAVLPAYLNALSGRGVHVLTFNEYLAVRDAAWMGPLYAFLGISVQAISQDLNRAARRDAYQAEVTYLTAKEAGYDFLRESIVRNQQDLVLRPPHFAIVDEADSIMIDEARVPLVLAGNDDTGPGQDRHKLAKIVGALEPGLHFQTDENQRNVFLTEAGIEKAEELLDCNDLHQSENLGLLTRLNQALHVETLLKREVDYIVRDDRVEVVDEYTGRTVPDRHWPDGLQRALEAKEGLGLKDQGHIQNSIAMQHFLNLYPKLSGMTGTALPAEREFNEFYKLKSVVIPPNRPCIRVDHEDVLFSDLQAKYAAIVAEVQEVHARGQPVLIGTCSVHESKDLADHLRAAGIDCNVLNAENDSLEAEIISQAGAVGAVTVSTNMAGRGTDIRLGGADELQREEVVASGGLYVIGTNRHESRRIDNQLRGRAGRQADPGMSRFFISVEDHLMQKFGLADLICPRQSSKFEPGSTIHNPGVHKMVSIVQNIIEGQNLDIRRTLWNYTEYIEDKRKQVHAKREAVLLARAPSRLSEVVPQKYQDLVSKFGRAVIEDVEQQIRLHHIDCAWRDYLANIADVRESIYLNLVGSRDPLQEFLKTAAETFVLMENHIEASIKTTFEKVEVQADGLDLDRAGLRGPSSTWTYIINDNPFEWNLSLAGARNIGSGAWAGVLAALFWFIPVGYGIGRGFYRLFRRRPRRK